MLILLLSCMVLYIQNIHPRQSHCNGNSISWGLYGTKLDKSQMQSLDHSILTQIIFISNMYLWMSFQCTHQHPLFLLISRYIHLKSLNHCRLSGLFYFFLSRAEFVECDQFGVYCLRLCTWQLWFNIIIYSNWWRFYLVNWVNENFVCVCVCVSPME